MDRRPNSGHLTVACIEPVARQPGSATATCDQAIFTCIRTPMGQGYRIIAASDGLHRSELAEIASRAPSGDGLCDDSPGATGMSFFRLGSGRYAVLHVVYAGKEPTGRGGQRTYTRALVLDTQGLRRFQGNPFGALRAAAAAGVLVIDLEATRSLTKLSLTPGTLASTALVATLRSFGSQWLGHLIEKVLSKRPLIVTADADPLALAEAVVLATPSPFRVSMSISAGLRFSVSRPNQFTLIRGDATRARQLARGRPVDFVDLTATAKAPSPSEHPWAQAVARLLADGKESRLVDLASERFTEADADTIEHVGRACVDLENVRAASGDELMDTAMAYAERRPAGPLERELSDEIVQAARGRLAMLIAGMDADALAGLWHDLMTLVPQPKLFARFGADLVRRTILHASEIAPLEAMNMTLEAADRCGLGWSADESAVSLAEGFDQVLHTVPRRMASWAATAETADLSRARALVSQWGRRFRESESERVAELCGCIDARLNENGA